MLPQPKPPGLDKSAFPGLKAPCHDLGQGVDAESAGAVILDDVGEEEACRCVCGAG